MCVRVCVCAYACVDFRLLVSEERFTRIDICSLHAHGQVLCVYTLCVVCVYTRASARTFVLVCMSLRVFVCVCVLVFMSG